MAARQPQARVALERVTIGSFDKTIRREPFTCGHVRIDNFLKHSAEDQHRKSYNRVYYAVYEEQLAGYYSLAAASRDPRHISLDAVKRFAAILSAPCVYLGMLAVDKELQGCGIGKKLMVHAMERTLAHSWSAFTPSFCKRSIRKLGGDTKDGGSIISLATKMPTNRICSFHWELFERP
jgi:GNAT superfamily N-acetyltransferase